MSPYACRCFSLALGLLLWISSPAWAQNRATLDYQLTARALAPGVYVVQGTNADFSPANGCNIINTGFIETDAGVLVVNTGPSRLYGEQLRALIARTTARPVVQVLNLNLHPDYFLGNQAFADVPRRATALTRAGMAREARNYEDNLYRLCGDWMKGTETLAPDTTQAPGRWTLGQRQLELRTYQGHTASDLVLVDLSSGVAFVGGLAFAERIPTTPHAQLANWLTSLAQLDADLQTLLPAPQLHALVPSHGPVRADTSALQQTRDYLTWLDTTFEQAAQAGLDMVELLRIPLPLTFRHWAAVSTEFTRNVIHLYPQYEARSLHASHPP
jgi:quinoprotein relay system zinc metallohydrolase 1